MACRLFAVGMIILSIFYGASAALAGSKTWTHAEGIPTCLSCKTSLSKLKETATKIESKSSCRTFKGEASYYGKGDGFEGKLTANQETFRPNGLTAAHRTLAFDTYVYVTNLKNGKTVKVRINDRGPYADNRILDLSYGAALKIGLSEKEGTTMVKVSTCGKVKKFKTPPPNGQVS
ncbi:MAG: septal ring lytic transglycosylase RlpA family protein [Pseudobdellovibrionaceae bacterium]